MAVELSHAGSNFEWGHPPAISLSLVNTQHPKTLDALYKLAQMPTVSKKVSLMVLGRNNAT